MQQLRNLFKKLDKTRSTQSTSRGDIKYDIHSQRLVWVETGELSQALISCLRGLCYFRTVRCSTSSEAITEITRGNVIAVVCCLRESSDGFKKLIENIRSYSLAIPIIIVGENDQLDDDFIKNSLKEHTSTNSKICYIQVGSTFVHVMVPGAAVPLHTNFLNRITYDRHYGTHEIGIGTPFAGFVFSKGRLPALHNNGFDEVLIHAREQALKLCPDATCYIVTEPSHGDDLHFKKILKRFPTIYPSFSCCEEVLSLYASGNTSGIVVSLGWGHIRVVPVIDGNPLSDLVRIMSLRNNSDINLMTKMYEATNRQGNDEYRQNARVLSFDRAQEILRDLQEKKVVLNHPSYSSKPLQFHATRIARAKYISDVVSETFNEPQSECWVTLEELFNAELYQYLAGKPDSEIVQETLPQMVRNCIETINQEDRYKICSTILLDGSIGWCDGFKERLSQELFPIQPSRDCYKWQDDLSPFDDDANISLDRAIRIGCESIFITTSCRGLLCKLTHPMTATDVKKNTTTPLIRVVPEEGFHAFQPHARYAEIPMEVLNVIFEYLGPLSVYCTSQSVTTVLEVDVDYARQPEIGVTKLLQHYSCTTAIPKGLSSEKGIRNLLHQIIHGNDDANDDTNLHSAN